ncbi:hypothetical protein JW899_00700 [Candidatus Uhrbacteria bacterium]|nr:hypothetical protein [Candidatus Uhrbacteria bacterium]
MKRSGEFNWASDIFDGREWNDSYRLDGKEVPNPAKEGEENFLVKVKDFGMDILSEDAIRWGLNEKSEFAPDGSRPATLAEGRAFAKAHPTLQLNFPVVLLGSFALRSGYRRVAVLDRCGGRRGLGGGWFDYGWGGGYRFLFVRK